ncbi:MAG: adenylate cyclase [Clostridia bacterium]|nr:adenylate cyclase [Clostridia bacterium]
MKKKKIAILILEIILIISIIIFFIIGIKKLVYTISYNNKVNDIMADSLEIEKKWLIDKENIPYDLFKAEVLYIEQTYISFSPEIRVRKINNGEDYTFAVKTNMTSDGMIRDELENQITEEEYNNLITKKEGNTIYKTRYQLFDGNNLLAIDIFSNDLEGLAYLEIEFENEEQANNFETPDWVIKDVTNDIEYKNGYLARFGIPSTFFEYLK